MPKTRHVPGKRLKTPFGSLASTQANTLPQQFEAGERLGCFGGGPLDPSPLPPEQREEKGSAVIAMFVTDVADHCQRAVTHAPDFNLDSESVEPLWQMNRFFSYLVE